MPVVRYQIRNEYGLADPELYRAADRDDPEALLEGVAMAGLVGVLRQLGDLAEFAAGIFHGLHEEVMATAARGHGLMLRVQQLEAEFPAIEKGFLSQTRHSHLSYNAGVDWHPNLQMDQNLVTRGDMPRFILDSYEECRGPPRLFMLDKFDTAGAGACLKRYSDPSFFKMDFASSGKMEPDIQREKKVRKVKKKGPRWRNGETPESLVTPHVNSKLEHMASDKAPESLPARRVKLKTRQLNNLNTSTERSYMECVLERLSPEHGVLSTSQSHMKMKSIDSSESVAEVRVVVMDKSISNPSFKERAQSESPIKQEVTESYTEERNGWTLNVNKKELLQKEVEVGNLPSTFNRSDKKEYLADADHKAEDNADGYKSKEIEKKRSNFDVCQRDSLADAESKTDGSLGSYRSDDIASELDNYMDALTTMESEMETDSESKAKPDLSFFKNESQERDSDTNEERELQARISDLHHAEDGRESLEWNSLFKKDASSPSNIDSKLSQGIESTHFDVTVNSEPCVDESQDMNSGKHQVNTEVLETESFDHSVPNIFISSIPSTMSESSEASESCRGTEATSNPIHVITQESPDDVQSVIVDSDKISLDLIESTEEIGMHLDDDFSPQGSSGEIQLVTANTKNMSSDLFVSTEELDKHSDRDLNHTIDTSKLPSKTEDDIIVSELAENSENFSDALLHLTDVAYLNVGMQDNAILEGGFSAKNSEEHTSEGVAFILGTSDLPPTVEAANLENIPSSCIEDSLLTKSEDKELNGSINQHPEADRGESISLMKYLPDFPLKNNSIDALDDGLVVTMENAVSPGEKSECSRGLENIGDSVENELQTFGILPLESKPSVYSDVPQESHIVDPVEFQPSHSRKEMVSDILEVCSSVSDHEVRDGIVHSENHLNLQDSSTSFGTLVELLPLKTCTTSYESMTENIGREGDSDQLDCADIYCQNSSAIYSDSQEEHVSLVSVLEKHKLEVTQTSIPKELAWLGIQRAPGVASSEERDPSVASFVEENLCGVASVEEYPGVAFSVEENPGVVASSVEENPGVVASSVEENPCVAASSVEENPSADAASVEENPGVAAASVEENPSADAASVEENPGVAAASVEENRVVASEEEDEVAFGHADSKPKKYVCDSSPLPDSGLRNYVCHREPFEHAQEQNPVKIVASHREEDEAIIAARDSKSKIPIFESSEPSDSKSGIDVSPQKDDKSVFSHQDSKNEQSLLNSSNLYDSEILQHICHTRVFEHAQINMHQDEGNELTISSLESEQDSNSNSLLNGQPHQTADKDMLPSNNFIMEPAVSSQEAYNDSDKILLQQKEKNLDLFDLQFERVQSLEQGDTQNNSTETVSQSSEAEREKDSGTVISKSENNGLKISASNASNFNQHDTEVCIHIQSTCAVSVSSLDSSISMASLLTLPSPGLPGSNAAQLQSSEAWVDGQLFSFPLLNYNALQIDHVEEAPPLPPLPPLQWRMGKLRPGSLMSNREVATPSSRPNQFAPLPSLEPRHCLPEIERTTTWPVNPFSQTSSLEDGKSLHGFLPSEREATQPLQSFRMQPVMEDERCQNGSLSVDVQMVHIPSNSFVMVSPVEDKKHLCGDEVLCAEVSNPLNPLIELPTLLGETESPQNVCPSSEGELRQPSACFGPLPGLHYAESEFIAPSFGSEMMHSSNPFLVPSSAEDERYSYGYRDFVLSLGENMQAPDTFTLSTTEDKKPNGRLNSLLNRPRDPLIEAVASHDKSTLRKVSELQPSTRPKADERNTLLEQIRKKSFNLKPATVAKPNIKGPPTNLKVAAILEKANAIRQAFVGSDEDDDGDSWSDG